MAHHHQHPSETAGRGLSRRRAIQLAGAGAGVMATASFVGIPTAHAEEPAGQPRLLTGDTYPIGFWWPPPPEQTTLRRYREIADAGFTVLNAGNGIYSYDTCSAMLAQAEAVGLPAMVADSRMDAVSALPPDQRYAAAKTVLDDYLKFPAFAAMYLADEPNVAGFGALAVREELVRRITPEILPFLNLFPTYANAEQLGAPSYQDYLDEYVSQVKPPYLMFDHYALIGEAPQIRADYFENWALVRSTGLRDGLPWWGFVLSCDHLAYRLPTDAELLWQANVALAYGSKGIYYFTYWTPEPPEVFRSSLVSRDGELTPLYYGAQRVNLDWLQPVGQQLLPLVSESVTHFGEAVPSLGVEVFTGDPWVSAAHGDPVILSRFRGTGDGMRWLLVVNRSFDAASSTTLTINPGLGAAFDFDPATRSYRPRAFSRTDAGQHLVVQLAPGAAHLIRLNGRPAQG